MEHNENSPTVEAHNRPSTLSLLITHYAYTTHHHHGHYTGQRALARTSSWRTGGFCWCTVLLPACPCWCNVSVKLTRDFTTKSVTVWTVTVCHNDSNRRMCGWGRRCWSCRQQCYLHTESDKYVQSINYTHTVQWQLGTAVLTHWVVVWRPTRRKTDLQNILRQPYDNAKVMIDLRWTNLLNTCEERKAFLRHASLAES